MELSEDVNLDPKTFRNIWNSIKESETISRKVEITIEKDQIEKNFAEIYIKCVASGAISPGQIKFFFYAKGQATGHFFFIRSYNITIHGILYGNFEK